MVLRGFFVFCVCLSGRFFPNQNERAREFVGLLLRFFFHHAVAFLDFPDQLIATAANNFQIAIGQLSPIFLHLAAGLLPFAFHLIPVHGVPRVWPLASVPDQAGQAPWLDVRALEDNNWTCEEIPGNPYAVTDYSVVRDVNWERKETQIRRDSGLNLKPEFRDSSCELR